MAIEKIPHIRNPLTVIGIFAAVAEIAATTALPQLDGNAQAIFMWFVMGFPLLLVVLFFLTLNFNRKVLYAPSDFRNEENFMNLIARSTDLAVGSIKISKQLKQLDEAIAETKPPYTYDIIGLRMRDLLDTATQQQSVAEGVIKDPYVLEFLSLKETELSPQTFGAAGIAPTEQDETEENEEK